MSADIDLIFVLFLILAGSALLGTLMLWARQALIIGYILAGISWKLVCWLADLTAKRNGEARPTVWPQAFGKASV